MNFNSAIDIRHVVQDSASQRYKQPLLSIVTIMRLCHTNSGLMNNRRQCSSPFRHSVARLFLPQFPRLIHLKSLSPKVFLSVSGHLSKDTFVHTFLDICGKTHVISREEVLDCNIVRVWLIAELSAKRKSHYVGIVVLAHIKTSRKMWSAFEIASYCTVLLIRLQCDFLHWVPCGFLFVIRKLCPVSSPFRQLFSCAFLLLHLCESHSTSCRSVWMPVTTAVEFRGTNTSTASPPQRFEVLCAEVIKQRTKACDDATDPLWRNLRYQRWNGIAIASTNLTVILLAVSGPSPLMFFVHFKI